MATHAYVRQGTVVALVDHAVVPGSKEESELARDLPEGGSLVDVTALDRSPRVGERIVVDESGCGIFFADTIDSATSSLLLLLENARSAWELAVETAGLGPNGVRDRLRACDARNARASAIAAWCAAIEYLEKGFLGQAKSEMYKAQSLGASWGDDSIERTALRILYSLEEVRASARTEEQWWAWHDADASHFSPGEDSDAATREAEARCASWVSGESDDGPSA